MDTIAVRGKQAVIDRPITIELYRSLRENPEPACDCAYCRNFRALGAGALPGDILQFFASAGIDPSQPAETYEYNESRPGYHLYGGEYYFIGSAALTDGNGLDTSGAFDFAFTPPSPLVQSAFHREGSVCFSFIVELPWVLPDAP
jgi:hypothetical protein